MVAILHRVLAVCRAAGRRFAAANCCNLHRFLSFCGRLSPVLTKSFYFCIRYNVVFVLLRSANLCKIAMVTAVLRLREIPNFVVISHRFMFWGLSPLFLRIKKRHLAFAKRGAVLYGSVYSGGSACRAALLGQGRKNRVVQQHAGNDVAVRDGLPAVDHADAVVGQRQLFQGLHVLAV